MTPLQKRALSALEARGMTSCRLRREDGFGMKAEPHFLFYSTAKVTRFPFSGSDPRPADWGVMQLSNAQCLHLLRQLPNRLFVAHVPIDKPV